MLIFGTTDGMNGDLRVAVENAIAKLAEQIAETAEALRIARENIHKMTAMSWWSRFKLSFKPEFIYDGPVRTMQERFWSIQFDHHLLIEDLKRLNTINGMLTKLWPDGMHLASDDAELILKYL